MRSRTPLVVPLLLGSAMAYVSRLRSDTMRQPVSWRIFSIRNVWFSDLPEDPRARAALAFSVLARKDKSWKRFQHMVDLAVEHQDKNPTIKSILDVGTDHGLLASSLATTGRFEKTLGVDVSPKALTSGGFELLRRIRAVSADQQTTECDALTLPCKTLEFRLSDGLKQVQPGEADSVCIAGMGVHLMNRILQASSDTGVLEVDRLNCQHLILQPTNSRPRNLMQLYHALHEYQWQLEDERIEYLAQRWYVSSSFTRPLSDRYSPSVNSNATLELPTSMLARRPNTDPMKKITLRYFAHHLEWIKKDESSSLGRNSRDEDLNWRDWVLGVLDQN